MFFEVIFYNESALSSFSFSLFLFFFFAVFKKGGVLKLVNVLAWSGKTLMSQALTEKLLGQLMTLGTWGISFL